MGIPSFFSYIVKNYSKIIYKINPHFVTSHFFLDSNSIIYNELYKILNNNTDEPIDIEHLLIENTCLSIQNYINIIKPTKLAYISFDGVAPVAKLKQQRTRRHKSVYQSSMENNIKKWDTCAITPGTEFMRKLHEYLDSYNFVTDATVIISSSFLPGEGEHKIFQHIRDNHNHNHNHDPSDNLVIYGLDADLIILALNHLKFNNNIYLFRETPHFIKTIDSNLDPDSLYLCDINLLGDEIAQILYQKTTQYQTVKNISPELKYGKITDYVFLSFFLGNDFMPHFPSANIRTSGIDIIINAYFYVVKRDETLIVDIDNPKINWRVLRQLLKYLTENEVSNICKEYSIRDKQTKSIYRRLSDMPLKELTKSKILENIPLFDRKIEEYIDPFKAGWVDRYYTSLFDIYDTNPTMIKNLCINYFEGLEWTLKYYTSGCPDWRWFYKYDYPPLFTDLFNIAPFNNIEFITDDTKPTVDKQIVTAIHPYVQLSYVLPKKSLNLIPSEIRNNLKNEWYADNYDFKWAFCKYFWEAHPNLPHTTVDEIESVLQNNF